MVKTQMHYTLSLICTVCPTCAGVNCLVDVAVHVNCAFYVDIFRIFMCLLCMFI